MPDHLHVLLSFPSSRNTVQQTVTLWKRWTARQMGIEWQRDFFEHRLRSDESWREKANYILANPEVAAPLLVTVKLRNDRFIWFAHIFLLMPDHAHALLSFPPSRNTVRQTITLWKRWTARQMGIEWQRDFFEHRLRSDESWREKAEYILANPVRKGLVAQASLWPHVFLPNRHPTTTGRLGEASLPE